MKKQAMNPFLPISEYIPDGEPHVFGDRIYLYGSHDRENGDTFCMDPYVFWSAPVDDLGNWSNQRVNYSPESDPFYSETSKYMYAPDCVKGNDGRYYLYYCLSGDKGQGGYANPISVAVSDSPDGKFAYYGFVRKQDGSPYLDHLNFDPALINDNGTIRLYFGSDLFWLEKIWPRFLKKKVLEKMIGRKIEGNGEDLMGAYHIELDDDMRTVKGEAKRIDRMKNEGYKEHRFFEGSSIRKVKDTYYFIYSSIKNHELCYATSKHPDRNFVYGGTIVSNGDVGYKGRKDADRLNMTGTTHGSIERINDKWYVFYHRLTHRSDYSRQACAEEIFIREDGNIDQAPVTSCGLNGGPLKAEGSYPAVICCNLTDGHMPHGSNSKKEYDIPYIGSKGNERYIFNIKENTSIVYKYFAFEGKTTLSLLCKGNKGSFDVFLDEKKICDIPTEKSDLWKKYSCRIDEKGTHVLTLVYHGKEAAQLKELIFE